MTKKGSNQAPSSEGEKQWDASSIKAIIGLGNAAAEYENTYHNVGISAVDWLRRNHTKEAAATKRVGRSFEYCRGKRLVWIKSLTFMNESGAVAEKALHYFNLRPEEILVIHDDSDLEIGRTKLSWNRGSAGHKGVESIISRLGTKKLWRLRIGIRVEHLDGVGLGTRKKAGEFVLKKIGKENSELLARAVKKAAEDIGLAGS